MDRTAPQLISRTPEDGANVVGRNLQMSLTFTEPLLPSNVQPRLFAWGGLPVEVAQLSEDGRTLTLQTQATRTLPSRYHLLAQDNGLSDLAGNRVGPIETSSVWVVPDWTADAPALHIPAGDSTLHTPRFEATASGTAYVTWMESRELENDFHFDVHVRRWDGTTWHPLGGKLNERNGPLYCGPSLAVDASGAPLVAFSQAPADGTGSHVSVRRWDGEQWVSLGGPLMSVPTESNLDVALAMHGEVPVLARAESNGLNRQALFVSQWNGTAWVPLGDPLLAEGEWVRAGWRTHNLSLIPDGNGGLLLAWPSATSDVSTIEVARYTGGTWQRLSPALRATTTGVPVQPSLTLDASGRPHVVWVEEITNGYGVYAAEWTGTTWRSLGTSVNDARIYYANHPSIAIHENKPLVVWSEVRSSLGSSLIMARQFDAAANAWQTMAEPFTANGASTGYVYDPSLTIDANGNLYLAFSETGGSTQDGIYVYRPDL
ncbi:Ig-like domain-containing protein [Pseudomyxococcus flavus]